MTVDELTAATCVDPADVRVVLAWIDDGAATPQDHIPTSVATAVGGRVLYLTAEPRFSGRSARSSVPPALVVELEDGALAVRVEHEIGVIIRLLHPRVIRPQEVVMHVVRAALMATALTRRPLSINDAAQVDAKAVAEKTIRAASGTYSTSNAPRTSNFRTLVGVIRMRACWSYASRKFRSS